MFLKQEGLFKEAQKSAIFPSNLIMALLEAFAYMFLGEVIGGICLIPIEFIVTISPSFKLLFELVFGFLFTMLLIFKRVKVKERRSLSSFGFQKKGFLKKYFIGFFIGFLTMGIVTLILFITGHAVINKNPTQPIGFAAIFSILIVLPGWMVQSATEEIVTRGWLMNILGAKYTPTLGLIVSSLFFAALHLLNPNVNFISLLDLILTGIFYGLYVIKTKSLWGACGIHAAWNFFQGNVFGFEVSGLGVEVGSIIDLNTCGNSLISGGAFGPEAGVVSCFINILGIIILTYLIKISE